MTFNVFVASVPEPPNHDFAPLVLKVAILDFSRFVRTCSILALRGKRGPKIVLREKKSVVAAAYFQGYFSIVKCIELYRVRQLIQ